MIWSSVIMARKRSSSVPTTHPLLLFSIITITFTTELSQSSFLSKALASHIVEADNDQVRLLLTFKAPLTDPSHFLSDWTANNSFSLCRWHGIACDNSSRVISIDLAAKNIKGNLSVAIFQLSGIKTLDLSSNQLTGELPSNTFESIDFNSLRYLNLSNNNLTGPVPPGSVRSLETLDLSNNMLSGPIPRDIGAFFSLKYLDLGGNVLSGTVPDSLSNISGLEYLTLASNQLSGEIPRGLCLLKSLKLIYFGYNNFSGNIPSEIGDLRSLQHLDLVYNNLSGAIPASLGKLSELRYVFLYQNKLSGQLPRTVFNLENLVSLDLSDNSLTGEVPEDLSRLQRLEILHLFSNNFSGKIPTSLASLRRLQVLQLWSNNFSDEIPRDLGKRNNLTVLDLSTNRLVGEIPPGLCESGRLLKLILFSNSLEGKIPERLSRCKSLSRVRLQNNRLSGEVPTELTKLPLVYFMDISGNNLSGKIGESTWDMASLQMLNLGRNQFYGKLPESFGSEKLENLIVSENRFSGDVPAILFRNLSKLVQLDLSRNELSGPIPGELSSCERLVSLDLSHNRFRGEIPETLAKMPVLGQLDLSDNELSGEIPRRLGVVESLVQVNVSYNRLHGSLPSTAAFLAINATAVIGNDGLCGGDSASGLPRCKNGNGGSRAQNHRPTWWFVVTCLLAATAASAVAVFAAAAVYVRRTKAGFYVKRVESEDGVWELHFFDSKLAKSVSIEDIVSSSKHGKGSLSVSNKLFIVKEIHDVNLIPPSVWSGIGEFGKVRHKNVVRLMAMCRSQKGGYFVYECVDEGKVLSEILRGLSWERRRKIAVGVARALRFLHCSCSSMVVVIGRVSPQEIVVDANGEPHLRLRLPGMLSSASKGFSSAAYVAPEAINGTMTEKSDIYGFGLILIELLSGKSPDDAEFGVHDSFVEWARYCYSDCHLDTWVDTAIRGHVASNQNEIVETMNLALHCTAGDPTARPCASDLCKTLFSVTRTTHSCVSGLKVTT